MGGGGGGRVVCVCMKVVSESTELGTFSCSPQAAVPYSNRMSKPTMSVFKKFHSPLGIADSFFSSSCYLGRPC